MRKAIIERFRDLNISGTVTGRVSSSYSVKSNTPKPSKVSAAELFGSGPIDHDKHVNCSCHPKESHE